MQSSPTSVLRRWRPKGKTLFEPLLRAIYPPLCMSCSAEVDTAGLCHSCWGETRFITGAICRCCGAPMIGEQDDIPCEECLAHPRNWAQGRAAVVYAGGGQRIVLALKHGDRLDLAKPIGRWMAKAADDLPPADIIAPVPLHWTRLIKRRFNQAALLAQQVSRHSNTPMIPDLLTRSKRTKAQKDMDRTERIANMSAAIDITHRFKERIKGQEVLLVDDVMTTGATLSACAQACLGAGAKNVNVLVFARVAPIQ